MNPNPHPLKNRAVNPDYYTQHLYCLKKILSQYLNCPELEE